jgi:ubiquinone biosynthesis protein UbiJ
MVTTALQTMLSNGLRTLLSTAPWAAQRLQSFSGCQIALELGGLLVPFVIDAEGIPALSPVRPERADLTVRVPLGALPLLLTDQPAALRQLHLEGNSGLAAEVGFLAKNFRPDLEELLSRVVGDVLAHRMAQTARASGRWARDSLRRLSESCSEYATEEARLIASRSSLHRFASEVERLAQDVQRLERRMAGRI